MWKNIVKPGTPHLAIWRMRLRTSCWISRNTNTHSECGTLIVFPLQQWLHERALLLRYTFITCLVSVKSGDDLQQPLGSKGLKYLYSAWHVRRYKNI